MLYSRVPLYLQPPPSDALRLMPLLRLIINQFARALMEHLETDAQGRAKRHRLILVLDEFPMLGRMPFFETMMGAMGGYGLKAFLIAQSLNHITKAYGRDNVILDNVHIVTAFAAADNDTAKRIADMAGEVWELRESETRNRPQPVLGWRHGATTIREERRPLLLPGDVRSLPKDEELIFVSGAKPIRAKKLKFDEEPVFAARLKPASSQHVRLSTAHDWEHVRSLGTIPQPTRKSDARTAQAKSALSKPLLDQPDLFAQAAARGRKISDQAMSGFRDAKGAPVPHPAAAADAAIGSGSAETEAPLRRAKGI